MTPIRLLGTQGILEKLRSALDSLPQEFSLEELTEKQLDLFLAPDKEKGNKPVLILCEGDEERLLRPFWDRFSPGIGVIVFDPSFSGRPPHPRILEILSISSPSAEIVWRIEKCCAHLEQELTIQNLARDEKIQETRLAELNQIGIALASERELHVLLDLIVRKAREFTHADAGSLYLVERDEQGNLKDTMIFQVAQNDSISMDFRAIQMPINPQSIAGFVALTGNVVNLVDAYEIPESYPFRFNRSFDEMTGYRSKSMLVIPLKNRQSRIIGVLQLINKKKDFARRLSSRSTTEELVIPFTHEDENLLLSLGGQAAVAIENAQLYQDIHRLLESFIRASVQAIEARDPTTRGHSERVAIMTRALAECVDREDSGPLASYRFTRAQLQEIYYAGLLHDFGKIGVREHVLVKAKKLYPFELSELKFRFRYIDRILKLKIAREGIELFRRYPRKKAEALLKEREAYLQGELQKLKSYLELVELANEPTVLPQEIETRLGELLSVRVEDLDGEEIPLLKPQEYYSLSIPKGSLTEEERKEIESHVVHTYQFLSMIPWTQDLREIPTIAYGHHEKLDGSGYPRKVRGEEIPIQTRMMTISDIYDALTAGDRPYKKALPPERALSILEIEVKDGKLDAELFRVFVEAEIFKKVFPLRNP